MYNGKNLDNVLERFVTDDVLTGCGMQVILDNQLIYSRCVGAAAVDRHQLLCEDTRLRIFSISKTFTCAALMTLYEEGMFALDDPIADYLPEFSNPMVCISATDIRDVIPAKTPVTIRQLLTMTSGIAYMAFDPGEGPVQKALLQAIKKMEADVAKGEKKTLQNLVEVIAQTPLCFQPGEHWLYGLSLSVIGRLVEVLSGRRFSDYVNNAIWQPLGLTRTCFNYQVPTGEVIAEQTIPEPFFDVLGLDVGGQAVTTRRGKIYGSKEAFMPAERLGFELPCGGMVSTLHDLGVFYAMLANGGSWKNIHILSRRTIDLMRANQLSPVQLGDFAWEHNRGFGYGLGYRTMLDPAQAGFYMPEGSFGWDGTSGCYALASPDYKLAVIFAEQSLPHHISYTIPRVMAALHAELEL